MQGRVIMMTMMLHNQIGLCAHAFGGLPLIRGTLCGLAARDEDHIWLQLRRDVPTEQDIGRPTFEVAICLQPGTAHKLALELLNIADRNKTKQAAKSTAGKQSKSKTGSAT